MQTASPLQKWSQYTASYCPSNGVYTLYSQWGIFHGGASGALTTIAYTNYASYSSMATQSIGQTDTGHYKVWIGTLAAGSSGRPVTGYMNGATTGFTPAVWSGSSATLTGSSSYGSYLSIGDWWYNGTVLEVIVWNGVALSSYVLDWLVVRRACVCLWLCVCLCVHVCVCVCVCVGVCGVWFVEVWLCAMGLGRMSGCTALVAEMQFPLCACVARSTDVPALQTYFANKYFCKRV